eukprot:57399_1
MLTAPAMLKGANMERESVVEIMENTVQMQADTIPALGDDLVSKYGTGVGRGNYGKYGADAGRYDPSTRRRSGERKRSLHRKPSIDLKSIQRDHSSGMGRDDPVRAYKDTTQPKFGRRASFKKYGIVDHGGVRTSEADFSSEQITPRRTSIPHHTPPLGRRESGSFGGGDLSGVRMKPIPRRKESFSGVGSNKPATHKWPGGASGGQDHSTQDGLGISGHSVVKYGRRRGDSPPLWRQGSRPHNGDSLAPLGDSKGGVAAGEAHHAPSSLPNVTGTTKTHGRSRLRDRGYVRQRSTDMDSRLAAMRSSSEPAPDFPYGGRSVSKFV